MPFEERAKGVIKCYFVMNRGKWLTARQISEFIQGNKDFKLGRYGKGLSPYKVSKLLQKNYFKDLQTKKMNTNTKVYKYGD